MFFCRTGTEAGWTGDFVATGGPASGTGVTGIDHVGFAQPFDHYDEAALFHRSVLGLEPAAVGGFAAPSGLVRSRAPAAGSGSRRRVSLLRRGEWAPGVAEPQYVALATDDVLATARAARAPLLGIPDDYYADLDARLDLSPARLAEFRDLGVLYETTPDGAYLQVCTEVLGGRLILAFVQRVGDYDGYGWTVAPVRMAAHRRRLVRQGSRA
ncbi:hypothetical protein I4J48_05380 [Pseudonocardia sp. KRD-169]|uniref:VOC domain-containing protein n=1 Tax=Pseudonocardia abyssalis TaxID=2792008 RepID=A0ABS6UWT5_9PSEU|nr:hypothetical protein [Pseudonocardia abyssalis]MBW0136680.1 hypothetical protein [Pseudonocardia abyssalis]